eukprot:TRINITY_DN3188_c0_g1_i2.p1 TRINITY_DN3188_c0_g1~~TRINITY_DN3188_c0_g1_i2.p1  ORF type:complete len:479 (-),score=76.45 TRINITY_DN3188_c0_g1_i2:14-1450(-)
MASACWKRFLVILENITLEPVVFLFGMSHGLYSIIVQSLYISKVCQVNLGYNASLCDDIFRHEDIQVQVQKYVSQLQAYNFFLQGLPAVIYSLFAGPWSDINGRKSIIVLSSFGYVFNNAVYLLNTVFFYELKAEYLLFECFQDCTGGYVAFFFACHSYITDITDEKSRTRRMAYLDGIFPIGFLLGLGLSGILKKKYGFVYCFSAAIVSSACSILYVIFVIKEKKKKDTGDGETASEEPPPKKESIFKMFQFKNVKTGLRATFRKRENGLRKYLLLLILAFLLELFLYGGRGSVFFLYFRKKFKWTEIDFSKFMIIFGIQGLLAQFFVIPFLTKRLQMRDATIILLGVAGIFISGFVFAFGNSTEAAYVAGVLGFLGIAIMTVLRSLVTKCISSDEIGKIFAVIASFQAVVYMLASPIYSMVYKATLDIFPGLVFLVTACLYSFVGAVVVYIYIGLKRIEENRKNEGENRGENLLKD